MDIPLQISFVGAFLIGFLGGVHCLGMCGGVVTALSFGASGQSNQAAYPVLFGYNAGRIGSYVIAGALMGAFGQSLFSLTELKDHRDLVGWITAVFMILLGVYLSGLWNGLAWLEKGGRFLWRYIEPLGKRFIPAHTFPRGLAMGLVWGWLPCGMVYTMLTWAVFSGSWHQGALLMLAFGLGTLPNLLAMGVAAERLNGFRQNRLVRLIAGLLVALAGLVMLYSLLR